MTDQISKLCDSILAKAHEFVGVGDFSAVTAAAEALTALAKCGYENQTAPAEPAAPPASNPPAPVEQANSVTPRDSAILRDDVESREVEATIDASLSGCGYEESDWQVIRGRWLTTEQAAIFAGCPSDTIRSWCRDKSLLCKLDPLKKRKVWLICPRSIACKLNNILDPRLKR